MKTSLTPAKYNAAYRLPNGDEVTVFGIKTMPNIGTNVEIPDGSGRFGHVISIELDNVQSTLRDFPIGEAVDAKP